MNKTTDDINGWLNSTAQIIAVERQTRLTREAELTSMFALIGADCGYGVGVHAA